MKINGGVAYATGGFALGISVSITANILHAGIDGQAKLPELVGAGFWPLALFVSTEILTRVPWPPGARWVWARLLGIGIVALVAAVVSYRHMEGLLASWGEDWINAYLGPLAVDGLMLISATALLAVSRTRQAAENMPAHIPAREVVGERPPQIPELPELQPVPLMSELAPITFPPIRLPRPVRRSRRPGRVAGRPATRKAPQAPAAPVPAPIPVAPLPAPVPVPAVNGSERELVGSPAAADRSRGQVTSRRGSRVARSKKSGTAANAEDATAKAREFWRAEQGQGRTPSAQQVADASGLSKSTAWRKINEGVLA